MRNIFLVLWLVGTLNAANVMRIACGSSTGGTDTQGHVWQSDAYFAGGTDYSRANMAMLDLPFRALRYGSFTYSVPLPNGDYTIKLSWLENRTAASTPPIGPGQRLIAASVAGSGTLQVVAANLDLFAQVGSMMPYTATFAVTVTNGKMIVSVGPATPDSLSGLLSGIQIDSVDPPPPPPSVTYLTGDSTAPPACPAVGLSMFYATDNQWLYWCFAGSTWHVVGDVKNAPPQLVKLDTCVGSGLSFFPDGTPVLDPKTGLQMRWDCAGMYRATIKRADGSLMPFTGSAFELPVTSEAVWAPIK